MVATAVSGMSVYAQAAVDPKEETITVTAAPAAQESAWGPSPTIAAKRSATATKTDAEVVAFETIAAICQAVSIPVVAIGGLNETNIHSLAGTGVDGVALVSAIFAKDDIVSATRELRSLSEAMTKS